MQRITPSLSLPLYWVASTRRIEQAMAATLPASALMQRAGLAVAQLAMALAPHARTIWLACGPGNNGGDGLEAAVQLHQRGWHCIVSWLGDPAHAPADARAAWQRANAAGVNFAAHRPDGMTSQDLCIDALLGIGLTPGARPVDAHMYAALTALHSSPAPILAVDIPSGLCADTGQYLLPPSSANSCKPGLAPDIYTLSLLTLKPGLFTASGRDAAGTVWLDTLGADLDAEPADAWLNGAPHLTKRLHASHKGSYGDVAIVGGAPGMVGAAWLAASAALHNGAGRVFVCPLDTRISESLTQPELMLRRMDDMDWSALTVVCGCGGGQAVHAYLPQILDHAHTLVLDADALNALATDPALTPVLRQRAQQGKTSVLTPHPLEAARLLGTHTALVQADRLQAAQTLADRYACTVVLKGSGTVLASPGHAPRINPTGNARLATAGTGDVLAGMIGAALAAGHPALDAASAAVWKHGALADEWPENRPWSAGPLAHAAWVKHQANERTA